MKPQYLLVAVTLLVFASCQSSPTIGNPSAAGFDEAGSDTTAIRIADEVMEAMGGRAAWDNVETIEWTFFGKRRHKWNKQTGNITIEVVTDSTTIDMVLENPESITVTIGDSTVTDRAALQDYYNRAESMWINDSYWLIMPYKLKDSGVTLTYLGEIYIGENNEIADQLKLTFKNVGITPENAYTITVPRATKLVSQWDFFRSAQDTVPNFSTPWKAYEQYGDILLSGDRGRAKLTDMAVTMLDG